VDRGRLQVSLGSCAEMSCVDIVSAPQPRLKVENIPMRPPQASQIDKIRSSTQG
jgi:hypothetical protein